jgi:hypothetical protein
VTGEPEELDVTPHQASYILSRLLASGRISEGEIVALKQQMDEEITELEGRLARLRARLGQSTPRPGGRTNRRRPRGT